MISGATLSTPYAPRLVDHVLASLLPALPAVLVVGPRATGKTTTARRHAAEVVSLDRAAEAAPFRADPDAALRTVSEPALLDEWQLVPEVLGAVKRAVDAGSGGNRFILTGSVSAELDPSISHWPGTGRLVRLSLYGMSIREQLGAIERESFFDALAAGRTLRVPRETPDLTGYVELALRSGFPEIALRELPWHTRSAWLESYVDQLLTRDVATLEPRRDPARLRRYVLRSIRPRFAQQPAARGEYREACSPCRPTRHPA